MQKELFTIPECCKTLNLGPTTLYKYINQKRIRAVKLGKKTLIPRDAIDEFIASLPSYIEEDMEVSS